MVGKAAMAVESVQNAPTGVMPATNHGRGNAHSKAALAVKLVSPLCRRIIRSARTGVSMLNGLGRRNVTSRTATAVSLVHNAMVGVKAMATLGRTSVHMPAAMDVRNAMFNPLLQT